MKQISTGTMIALLILFIAVSVQAQAPKKADPKQAKSATPAGQKAGYTDPATGMEFVLVKGGCFQMGNDEYRDESPAHEVCVDDFYIGKYEVTQKQWRDITGMNPSMFKACGDNCPVESINWRDAHQLFIGKLNEKSGKNYRLPTEAEWEYAARSRGKKEQWAGTNDPKQLGNYAWHIKNSGNTTHPVGKKKPNALGIYDMTGNVAEWTEDWHDNQYYYNSPKKNPMGPATGTHRVIRGGSWSDNQNYARVTSRHSNIPDSYEVKEYYGIRLVLPVTK